MEKNNAIILSHLGMGDMLGFIPAIRKFCNDYDQVFIFSKEKNKLNVFEMYEDVDNLNIIVLDDNENEFQQVDTYLSSLFKEIGKCDIIKTGLYLGNHNKFEDLPDNFYLDADLPLTTYQKYFKLPSRLTSNTLLSKLLDGIDYNFMVGNSSTLDINDKILEKISNNYLIINPHLNVYEKNHEHYELSQTFLDLKMFDYVNVIKNAKEVHLIDSSFSLLSKFVSSKKSKKFLYNKSGYKLSSGFFSGWEIIQS